MQSLIRSINININLSYHYSSLSPTQDPVLAEESRKYFHLSLAELIVRRGKRMFDENGPCHYAISDMLHTCRGHKSHRRVCVINWPRMMMIKIRMRNSKDTEQTLMNLRHYFSLLYSYVRFIDGHDSHHITNASVHHWGIHLPRITMRPAVALQLLICVGTYQPESLFSRRYFP